MYERRGVEEGLRVDRGRIGMGVGRVRKGEVEGEGSFLKYGGEEERRRKKDRRGRGRKEFSPLNRTSEVFVD